MFLLQIYKRFHYLCAVFDIKATLFAAVAQLVEHQLPKLRVTGSNPACRSSENQIVTCWLSDFFVYICYKIYQLFAVIIGVLTILVCK